MEVRPLVAAVLLCFATLSGSQRMESCQSGEDCPDDQCCVVLPWIPSNKGGICAKHTQKGEVCWPPHHDYKKYLFYCPCGKELKCKPLHAFEKEQNMTFHLDVCVDDNGDNDGQETENPDNVENPEGDPQVSSEKNPEKEEDESDDNPDKEDDEKEEGEKEKEGNKEGEPQDENEESEAEKDGDYSGDEADDGDDNSNDDEEDEDYDYNEPTKEERNELDEYYNEPTKEERNEDEYYNEPKEEY